MTSDKNTSKAVGILESLTDLTGPCTTVQKFGVNTTNGNLFFVDANNTWQSASSGSVSTPTEFLVTVPTFTLPNSGVFDEAITVTGILLSKGYLIRIKNSLATLQAASPFEIRNLYVEANNKIRLTIANKSGMPITFPALTISALKLN